MKSVWNEGRVCIVIPAFKRPEGLATILDSLRSQTRSAEAVVIVDKPGAANARNAGIAAITDDIDYVAFWDDDDNPHANYVEVLAGLLDANPDCGIAACGTRWDYHVMSWRHRNTPSRMVRRKHLRGQIWPSGVGGDKRWWLGIEASERVTTCHTEDVLYEVVGAPGGQRHREGFL